MSSEQTCLQGFTNEDIHEMRSFEFVARKRWVFTCLNFFALAFLTGKLSPKVTGNLSMSSEQTCSQWLANEDIHEMRSFEFVASKRWVSLV